LFIDENYLSREFLNMSVSVFAAMMTNMCLILFMFINDKYIFRVFMHKRKIYLWF